MTNSNSQATTQNMFEIIAGGVLIREGRVGKIFKQSITGGGTAIRHLRVEQLQTEQQYWEKHFYLRKKMFGILQEANCGRKCGCH